MVAVVGAYYPLWPRLRNQTTGTFGRSAIHGTAATCCLMSISPRGNRLLRPTIGGKRDYLCSRILLLLLSQRSNSIRQVSLLDVVARKHLRRQLPPMASRLLRMSSGCPREPGQELSRMSRCWQSLLVPTTARGKKGRPREMRLLGCYHDCF